MRHPALVENHLQDILLPGQNHQQPAVREGDGHAGRHQSRIFHCRIICPYHVVYSFNCFQYFSNVKYNHSVLSLHFIRSTTTTTAEEEGVSFGRSIPDHV